MQQKNIDGFAGSAESLLSDMLPDILRICGNLQQKLQLILISKKKRNLRSSYQVIRKHYRIHPWSTREV